MVDLVAQFAKTTLEDEDCVNFLNDAMETTPLEPEIIGVWDEHGHNYQVYPE